MGVRRSAVCVCVCGGRGKCHMRCSNKTNSEETSRVSEAAARIQDSGSSLVAVSVSGRLSVSCLANEQL